MKTPLKTLPIIIKNGRIALNFKLSDVKAMAIVGIDLVALMQDGTRLLLPGLALKILERPSPELQFEDQQLSGAELFTKVDIDSTTLKDADEALQVPVSEPTAHDPLGASDQTQAAAPDSAGETAAKEGDKGAQEAPAWYQQYGWVFGLVGLVGLALGLSGGKKGGGKEEDKPAAPPSPDAGDNPGSSDDGTPPADGDTDEKPVVNIFGDLAAGVFNHAQTLSVTLYDGQGQRLGKGDLTVGTGGQVLSYRTELPDDYVGFVRVVVSDGVHDGLGFIDEFRQATALAQGMTPAQAELLASTDFPALNAIGYRSAGQSELVVSVTPLTELVARLLGVPADPTQPLDGTLSVEQVNAMAAAVAKLATQFTSDAELLDVLGPVVAINAENFAAASGDAKTYGKVLAGLTGLDAVSGALENTLHLLTSGLTADADGTLRIAPTVEGAILMAAMQQANTLLGKLVDNSLFETFSLPEAPWANVTATFTDAAEPVSPTLDLAGKDARPSVTVSWAASPDLIAAGQVLALYLFDGRKIASHALTQADVDAGSLVLRADDYGTQTLGEDGVKRLFAGIVSETGELVARSELRTYGLVSVEVNSITGLSSDTGISPSDFITNQPVQAVSGTYLGTLGSNTHIEVSADGGKTWAAAKATPALEGPAGGTWVSDSLRLDGAAASEASKLLTRVTVSGVNGEQPLTLPSASHDFVLDVSPPDAAVASIDSISAPFVGAMLPGGFLFTQASQTIRGTVQGTLTDDDRVMVSIDGGASWILGELSEDGAAWSVTVGFAKHGSGEILARINDVAGNTTASVARPYQFTEPALVGVPPTQAARIITVTDDVGDPSADPYDFAGPLSSNMSTDDRRPTLNGTLSAALEGDQVLVLVTRINGGAEQLLGYANVAPPSQEGQLPEWSFTPVSDMALGSHNIMVKVFSPGANAFAPAYPDGVDAETPGAQSNWGSWDVNVQSISFDGVIIPGVTSVNLLTSPNRVTDNAQPILTGTLGSLLAPDEYVALYDAADGREPKLIGRADITPADNGAGATWRYTFQDDAKLSDGVHQLRAVVERPGQDGTRQALLNAAAPSVTVSTELPDQQVIINQVLDDVGAYLGAIASGESTDDTAPALSGTLSAPLHPGQKLQVRIENADDPERFFTYTPVLDLTGLAWSLSINPALPVGNYNLRAGVVNAGGAMGPLNANFNLRINSLTFSHLDDAAGPITGNVFAGAEPFLTDDNIPILRGQLGAMLNEGETLRIVSTQAGKETILGNATLTPRAQGGVSWQLTMGVLQEDGRQNQLPDGRSTLSAQVIDTTNGQVRLVADRVIHVDNGTPTERANISEVRDQTPGSNGFVGPLAVNQSTDDRQPMISGVLVGATALPPSRAVQIIDSLTGPDGVVTETVLGLATVRDNGSWSFRPENSLALGDHTFSARVINRASGESGPAGQSFTVRENQITFNTVQDAIGALQGNLLDNKLFAQPPYTDDTRPQLSGQLGMPLGPNERVVIYDTEGGRPPALLGTATVNGTSWVFRPAADLRSGTHTFQVRVEQTQAGGNSHVLLSTATPTITIDGVATPVTQSLLTLTVTDNNGSDGSQTGMVPFRASTDDRRPVVSGTLSAALTSGQQLHVFASLNGGAERKLGVATLKGANWTYTLTSDLPYGPTTILARVVAINSGLTSNTLSTMVNVNGITLSSVTETTTGLNVLDRSSHGTGDNHVTLQGKLASPLLLSSERVTVYAKTGGAALFTPIGVATLEKNGTEWSFSLPDRNGVPQTWKEGQYEISVRIEDVSSRFVRATTQTNFTVDTLAPQQLAEITGYQDQIGEWQSLITTMGVSTDDANGIIHGTIDKALDSPTRGVVLYDRIDGQLVRLGEATVTGTTWTFRSPGAFVSGMHSLIARVENLVANKHSAESTPFTLNVQQVFLDSIVNPAAPDQNILAPSIQGVSSQGLFTISGRLSTALAPDEELKITVDGVLQERKAAINKDGMRWSYTLSDDQALANGAHAIGAQIMDSGGAEKRVVSVPHMVYIDNGTPTETVTISKARDNRATGSSFVGDNASGVSSDDPLPLLKGTVSAALPGGRSIAIYGQMPGQDKPAFLGYATVTAKTAWTFQVDQELPFGDTVFTARVVNRADRETLRGPASPDFIVSEQDLNITALIDHKGAVTGDLFHFQATAPAGERAELRTNDLRPTLTGRLAAPLKHGETISIFYGSAKLGTATINSDGVSWSFTPQADIPQGAQRFSAVLLSADGTSLISAQTPAVAVSVLQPGHAVTITSVLDSNNLSNTLKVSTVNVSTSAVLDDARPILSGTLAKTLNTSEVLHIYTVDSAGGKHLLGTATTSGKTWTLPLSVSLPLGASQLQAAIENKADGHDAVLSAPISINVVSLSRISIDDLSSLDAVASPRPMLRASVDTDSPQNLSVRVWVDGTEAGTANVGADGAWNFQIPTDLSAGAHRVEYSLLKDGAPIDAIMRKEPTLFTVGSADAPSFSVTMSGTAAPIITKNDLTVLTGTTSAPVTPGMGIMISIDGKDVGLAGLDASQQNWSYPLWAPSPGAHAVTVRPINLATLATLDGGGAQTTVYQNQITIKPPSDALTSPNGELVLLAKEAGITLSGQLAGPLPDGSVLQVRRDDVVLGTATVKDSQWSYQLSAEQQIQGVRQYSVAVLPQGADAGDASVAPALSAQATLNFITADSGPSPLLFVSISGLLTDRLSTNLLDANAMISNPFPILRGTTSSPLASHDQIVVFGQAPGGTQTRLGVARMLTDTTWEFKINKALPPGDYTLTAMPENRLTRIVNDIAEAKANFQVQYVAITMVNDRMGAIQGNVLEGNLTDDGTPLIQGTLTAPLRDNEQYLQISDTVSGVTTILGRAQIDKTNPLKWSFLPSLPLADGQHTLSVAVLETNTSTVQTQHQVSFIKDSSTPTQTVSITQVRDDDGPVIGNVPVNGAIAYLRPLISGTISTKLSNAQVLRIWQDDGKGKVTYLGDATVNGTNWSWRSDKDMAPGSVNLFATVDNAAKVGQDYPAPKGTAHGVPSSAYSFRLQTLDDIQIQNASGDNVGNNTSERRFTISGTLAAPLSDGEYIEILDGSRVLGRAVVNDQDWSFSIGKPLGNGEHNFKISIVGFGNNPNTPLVFEFRQVNVHEAALDPLQAGLIEAVIALPGTQSLSAGSSFDTLMGQSTRPGQSLNGGRVGIFGTLALAPRGGDLVQVFDNGELLGTASVSGTRWWYNANSALPAGEHRFTLRINEQEIPVSDPTHAPTYPVQALDADAIQINDLSSRTDTTQSLSGSLLRALGVGEVLGVYRTLNGETVRLGNANVQNTAGTDGRFAWQFTPNAALTLGVGAQTLTVQVEGATHARIAATQSASILIDEAAIATAAAILSVSVPQSHGLVSLKSGASVANPALMVSGALDRDLIGSERVALYNDTTLIGYATVGANGRNWTYTSTGMGNGNYRLTAVVENEAGIKGPNSQPFALEIVAQTPGQTVMLTSVQDSAPLGSAVALDTQGFSVFVWNMDKAIQPDITNIWSSSTQNPTAQAQVPQINFDTYNKPFLPDVPYKIVANYVGSGWFHVSPEQAGIWSFRSPKVDDYEIISIDGTQTAAERVFTRTGITSDINLDAGWHYLRVDTGNTGGPGYWTMQWRRPGESEFSVIRDIQTGPAEKAVALGAKDQAHALTLGYSLSAPLGKNETLQVVDLTAHRTADGLRLQFWNLPQDDNRTFQEGLALMSKVTPVVSRMTDSVFYNTRSPYDTGVISGKYSTMGQATGWFHVSQAEAGTWLFRGSNRFDHVQLKIDGHTLLSPDKGFPHAQYASMHLEAGWHYLDSTLFQGDHRSNPPSDWDISVIKPGDTAFATLTGFAQFESGVLGKATVNSDDPTAFSFKTTIADGNSHTLLATVVKEGSDVTNTIGNGKSGMAFLANGAFGIVDKKVSVAGDGQLIDFAAKHGAINLIDLDADKIPNILGNTLVIDATDIRQADIGSAASLNSPLLDSSSRQLVVLGGDKDVLRFGGSAFSSVWKESGRIDVSDDSRFTVFSHTSEKLQVIVDTHVMLDLDGALRSNTHPII